MMNQKFSTSWKVSIQPRKQRKYIYNSPLHLRKNFLSAILAKNLREKYHRKNVPLRKGDTVKILRGQFKKKEGKINRVSRKKLRIYVEGISLNKKDGSKVLYGIHPSNVMIVELDLFDKGRQKLVQLKTDAS